MGHIARTSYYSCSSLVASATDPNSQTTSFTYDFFDRPLVETRPPGGGSTTYSFNDDARLVFRSIAIGDGVGPLTSEFSYDGLGRILQRRLTSDPKGTVYMDTTYDGLGRKATASNPYRFVWDPLYGFTNYEYDALGRVTKVIPPDGTATSNNIVTTYAGNKTTVTDQAGKQRRSSTDALGRLTQVDEPNPTLSTPAVTTYTYDTLDNLTQVVQSGSRQRTFTYNSLAQLTSASNPESNSTTYTYDADGNLITKDAPRPNQTDPGVRVITTYGYDALHRLRSKTYSDSTPAASYVYDDSYISGTPIQNPIGRLVRAEQNCAGTISSYDAMGRVVGQWQWTPPCLSPSWVLSYSYNLLGGMTSYTNGMGVTFWQSFNAAGQVTQVTSSLNDAQHPGTLAWDAQYSAAGAIEWMYYGNGLLEARAFNNRMQPCRINVNSSWTAVPCQGSAPSGNVLDLSYGYNHGTANNGSVTTWAASGQQNWSRTYSYDELNRVKTLTANSGGPCSLSWTYDIWGNRTQQNVTGGSGCWAPQFTFDNQNRITNTGYSYDAAGNLLSDGPPPGSHTYQWDAENKLKSLDSTGATYTYDAFGRRVQKTVGAAQTHYLYDLAGNVLTEINQSGGWQAGYIYLNGQLLAEYKDSTTYFAHRDHLASTRVVTRVDQSLRECDDYLPFGELLPCGDTGATSHKFTGLERDAESSLDHTWFRKLSPTQGRFCSADPLGGDISDPQSLNRFAYVLNDPVDFVDPAGLVQEEAPYRGSQRYGFFDRFDIFRLMSIPVNPQLRLGPLIPDREFLATGLAYQRAEWIVWASGLDVLLQTLGSRGPWWESLGFKDDPRNLVLVVQSDCVRGVVREITYSLQTKTGIEPNGKNYQITEHQTNSALVGRPGPAGSGTSTGGPNSFIDNIGGLGVMSSLQYFTISSGSPAKTPGYPVPVRNAQGNFGVLGIYIKNGQVFINGSKAQAKCK